MKTRLRECCPGILAFLLLGVFAPPSLKAAKADSAGLPALSPYGALEESTQPPLRSGNTDRLTTRWFKVDPALMIRKYGEQSLLTSFMDSLRQVGVDLRPPKNCFYTYGKGMLMVRATAAEVEIIQREIKDTQSSSPMIALHIHLVRYPAQKDADILPLLGAANSLGGSFKGPPFGAWSEPLPGKVNADQTSGAAPVARNPSTWILAKDQSKFVLDKLRASPNAEVLTVPRFFSPNRLWTSVDLAKKVSEQDSELFPALNVGPEVEANRQNIRLNLRQRAKEFAAYDLSGRRVTWDDVESAGVSPELHSSQGLSLPSIAPPTAIFQQVQSSNSTTIAAGQTLVVSGLMPEKQLPKGSMPFPWLNGLAITGDLHPGQSSTAEQTRLLIFITPIFSGTGP